MGVVWSHLKNAWLLVVAACLSAAPSIAAESPVRAEIWDIALGMAVDRIPHGDFIEISCGTNGGPPSVALSGFDQFAHCRAEPSGLSEVTFEYDDELEYWAKANESMTWIARYSGTRVMDQPAIVSVLLDDAGTVRGLRVVSDPRVEARERRTAILFSQLLKSRFGGDKWACLDEPLGDGETAIGTTYVKERCRQETERGAVLLLSTNYFRKKGQYAFDPHTGAARPGDFEASCRFEMLDSGIGQNLR